MGKLSENMQTIIDRNDPNQKLMGLLAVMIEEKLDSLEINTNIKLENNHDKLVSIERKIDETNKKMDESTKKLDEKIDCVNKEIDFIIILKKYKWILGMVFIGVATTLTAGLDKLISLF